MLKEIELEEVHRLLKVPPHYPKVPRGTSVHTFVEVVAANASIDSAANRRAVC